MIEASSILELVSSRSVPRLVPARTTVRWQLFGVELRQASMGRLWAQASSNPELEFQLCPQVRPLRTVRDYTTGDSGLAEKRRLPTTAALNRVPEVRRLRR